MKTSIKIVLVLLAVIFLYTQFFPPSDDATQQASTANIPSGPNVKEMVEVLATNDVGTYTNYHFLVLQPDSFTVEKAKYIAQQYCSDH